MFVIIAIIPINATPDKNEGLGEFFRLRALVEEQSACSMPGVQIKYDTFIPVMWRAVASGHVSHESAVLWGKVFGGGLLLELIFRS